MTVTKTVTAVGKSVAAKHVELIEILIAVVKMTAAVKWIVDV